MISAAARGCLAPAPLRSASAAAAGRRSLAAMAYRATWNGAVLAESDATVEVEGNQYFPPDAIKKELFTPSATKTHCGWKGEASYYNSEFSCVLGRPAKAENVLETNQPTNQPTDHSLITDHCPK
jgi:hypothetical protein